MTEDPGSRLLVRCVETLHQPHVSPGTFGALQDPFLPARQHPVAWLAALGRVLRELPDNAYASLDARVAVMAAWQTALDEAIAEEAAMAHSGGRGDEGLD